jgi:hypothetical protein
MKRVIYGRRDNRIYDCIPDCRYDCRLHFVRDDQVTVLILDKSKNGNDNINTCTIHLHAFILFMDFVFILIVELVGGRVGYPLHPIM